MPLSIQSLTFESRKSILATFSEAVQSGTVDDKAEWAVAPTGALAAEVQVTAVSVLAGQTQVRLTVHPGLTPGQAYKVTAASALAASGGAPASPNNVTGTVQASLAPGTTPAEWPHGGWSSVLDAIGEELATLSGRPATRLLSDLPRTGTGAEVETTLGFPRKGRAFFGSLLGTFTSRSDGGLHGLSFPGPRIGAIPRGTVVVLDVTSTEPD